MLDGVRGSVHLCHGIVLNEQTVMTLATCVTQRKPEAIGFGRNRIESYKSDLIRVSEVHIHPDFDLTKVEADVPVENNVALLRLSSRINFKMASAISPACLTHLSTRRVHPEPQLIASGLSNDGPKNSNLTTFEAQASSALLPRKQQTYKQLWNSRPQILRAGVMSESSPLCSRDQGTPLHVLQKTSKGNYRIRLSVLSLSV
jgi:hypothetical protein